MDAGLLILRVVLGLLLVGHGTQKLFGVLGGPGLERTGHFFSSLGFRPGPAMARVAGWSEAGAGLLLILGLLTPLAATAVIGTLFVASSVHWKAGVWGQNGGFELPMFYAVTAVAVACTGPGAVSLDHLVGLGDFNGVGWGVLSAALGIAAGFVVVSRARRALGEDAVAEATGPETYPDEATDRRISA